MQLKRKFSRSHTLWQVTLSSYGMFYAKCHLKGCLLRSLHGPRRAHLLLHWHFDGLALRMLPLISFPKNMVWLNGIDRRSWA